MSANCATYVVVKGDTLWAIAKRELGDPLKWRHIAGMNRLANPDRIYPGDELKLPKPPTSA